MKKRLQFATFADMEKLAQQLLSLWTVHAQPEPHITESKGITELLLTAITLNNLTSLLRFLKLKKSIRFICTLSWYRD